MSTPRDWPLVCEEHGCKQVPIVGVGEPPRYVCVAHFEAFMASVAEVAGELAAAITEGRRG